MIVMPVNGLGVRAPGIIGWADLVDNPNYSIPTGPAPNQPVGLAHCLPPTERRRATPVTRLALDLAMEAAGERKKNDLTTVFCSSGGEVNVVHQIFGMLKEHDTALSPTAFHNSVHNAAAGYWSIASGSGCASDSLCAYNDSFGAGLAECSLRFSEGQRNLLLAAYDVPPPHPISEHRKIHNVIGGSLLLGVEDRKAVATLTVCYEANPLQTRKTTLCETQDESQQEHPESSMMYLLLAIARKEHAHFTFNAGFGGQLQVEVTPCS